MSKRRVLGAFERMAALCLPLLAVGVVAVVVLAVGRTHPVFGARLRGGPTEGALSLSYRLEIVQRHDDAERGAAGRIAAVAVHLDGGEVLSWRGTLDDEGAAAVAFGRPRQPVTGAVVVSVTLEGVPGAVAAGRVRLTPEEWSQGAKRRGGWVESAAAGEAGAKVVLRAAAGRGAFAVPFADPLLVTVTRGGVPFAGAVTCECAPGVTSSLLLTPGAGNDRVGRALIQPLEHATSAPLVARDADGTTVTLDVTLAVIPGALHAELATAPPAASAGPGFAETVRVESPIVRERAYVAIVSERERIAGGTVALQPTTQGTAVGFFAVDLPREIPLWAVVSSEPDLHTEAVVGWPLRAAALPEAPRTFDVKDALVLDSVGENVRAEVGRSRRARLSAALFAFSAILLAAALVARRARAAQIALEAHLSAAGADPEAKGKMARSDSGPAGLVIVALLCLVLAGTLVGLFAAWV